MGVETHRAQDLFAAALKRSSGARQKLLAGECAGDSKLRGRVEALLAAYDAASGFGAQLPLPSLIPACQLPEEEPGAILADRYQLSKPIGEGGMGTVWMAEQTYPVRRTVAIKLIKAGMDTRQVSARFETERQALALMDHPNIAKVLDGGVSPSGRPFFVMEYVPGVPLTRYCDEARLPLRERLQLFTAVCLAVQHAHQKGIIHRDLKPSNILVCVSDGQPLPKVIDFGLAKATREPLSAETLQTMRGQLIGTPLYMSPEQAEFRNLDVDTRSDVYSLGVILYELLTGTTPLARGLLSDTPLDQMLQKIRDTDPPRPSLRLAANPQLPTIAAQRGMEPRQLRRALQRDLDWIALKALDKERDRRYQTANGLARDVGRYLQDEVVDACPPSRIYRMRKFIRKHRAGLLTTAAFGLVLPIGSVLSVWQAVRARYVEQIAVAALESEATQRNFAQKKWREAEELRGRAEESARTHADLRRTAEELQAKAEAAEAQILAEYRASTDEAMERLIGSKAEVGPNEKSYLESALRRWQGLAARQGSDERSLAIRGEGYHRVALLWQKLGRDDEARPAYQSAREIRQSLVERFPDQPRYRQDLALTSNNLAVLLANLGRPAEARAQHQAALEIRTQLLSESPDRPGHAQDLASTRLRLGAVLSSLWQPEEALIERSPESTDHRVSLGAVYCNAAMAIQDEGPADRGLEWFDRAIETLEPVLRQQPRNDTARQFLRNSHCGRAITRQRLADFSAAAEDWGRVLELSSPAERPHYLAHRAYARLRSGRVREALGDAEELSVAYYEIACVTAAACAQLLELSEKVADQALAALRRALAPGSGDVDPLEDVECRY